MLAVEPARAGDANGVVQRDRGTAGAALLEVFGLVLKFF